MKKVISINFQGRVVPIEESAYEILKQYIESLRNYFVQEEGRDEIINDIEGRIAEIFSERLKKGITCITDADVNEVIAGMGRPADFEAAGGESASGNRQSGTGPQDTSSAGPQYIPRAQGRFYRNADDKIIGGVASGLANYLNIDPVVMRIIFVLLFGALFWVYILLWIIVPSRSLHTQITKRLYRSMEEKVIGGVCGGLAAYFNVDVWIPRLIFALPLVLGLLSVPFHFFESWDFWMGPRLITNSLGSTLLITYIILWIAVPVATTAAQKLEMKGERIDLNSIRDTVKEDLQSIKSKAKDWGEEVKQSARQFGERASELGQTASSQARSLVQETAPVVRSTRRGIGHVIGVLFKAFFLFIGGIIALVLFGVLVGLLAGGVFVFPFKDFLLEGYSQQMLIWGLLLFLAIPIIALITWLVRRILGVRSRRHYLGFIFGGLFLIGLFSIPFLFGSVARNFKARSGVEDILPMNQPQYGKLFVEVERGYPGGSESRWFRWEEGKDWPLYGAEQDSLLLQNVRIHVVKSKDNEYHLTRVRMSRGRKAADARALSEKIFFVPVSSDSLLVLPRGFGITTREKFRNQQVMLVIEIPVGKRIQMGEGVQDFRFYNIRFNQPGMNIQWDEEWDETADWMIDAEYIMTPDNGLVRTSQLDPEALKKGEYKITDPGYRENRFEKNMDRLRDRIDSVKNDVIESVTDGLEDIRKIEVRVPEVNGNPSGEEFPDKAPNAFQRSLDVFGSIFRQ